MNKIRFLMLIVCFVLLCGARFASGAPLEPGDADQDLDFDQFDLILSLQAAKYLTAAPATWGEGDWDGGPGGTPGTPPMGDNAFNQLDLIKSQNTNRYFTGPYGVGGLTPPDLLVPIRPGGMPGDDQTSILYDAATGEIAVDAPDDAELTSINIQSRDAILIGDPSRQLGGSFDIGKNNTIFKAVFGASFASISFGQIAFQGLSESSLLDDLSIAGSLHTGGGLGDVDLIYVATPELPPLFAGDANIDYSFDQFDLIKVQQAAKYLTGDAATWGDGDWNGAPGGDADDPPDGDGVFNQFDIIAAQQAAVYLTGPYAVLNPGGREDDVQTSIVYNPATGAVAVDAPMGIELTSINIDSAAGIFTGAPAQNLGGSFDNDADNNIFKATFGSSFGSLSFGNVAQSGLSREFVLGDLTVIGSLAGGGDLGDVDLIYVPEPATILLGILGLLAAISRPFLTTAPTTSGIITCRV